MSIKQPPQNKEAEMAVLGGIMLESDLWVDIRETLNKEDFYFPAHKTIFEFMARLHKKNLPMDPVLLQNELQSQDQLNAVGGGSYLAELLEQTPTSAFTAKYADIVKEKSILRKVLVVSREIHESCFQENYPNLSQFLDSIESKIFELTQNNRADTGLVHADELIKSSLEKIQLLYQNKGQITGVSTGYVQMDDMTAGLQPGELIIMAARPSMGKTAFSLNIAAHAAFVENKTVAYFSVEMPKEQVMIRMLGSEASVPLSDLRVGNLEEAAWERIIEVSSSISQSQIYIDDTSGISPYEIRSKARNLKAKQGLDLIMIDYLQLMSLNEKVESREREVSEISKSLKAIAKELRIPVVALAQLNRSVEGRQDRRPMLSDLRESGSIEQDADVIMMIYREDYYERENPTGEAEIIIGKQRNGPTGTVKLTWDPMYGRFSNPVEHHLGPSSPLPPGDPFGNFNDAPDVDPSFKNIRNAANPFDKK